MGEALITRRGGGVKSGTVTAIDSKTIQSDDLKGARNAVLVATTTSSSSVAIDGTSTSSTVASVTIKNGQIVGAIYSTNDDTIAASYSENILLDQSTGTLSIPGSSNTLPRFVTKESVEYMYVVYE